MFVAQTMPENHQMQEVFKHVEFGVRSRFDHGVVEVRMDLVGDQGLANWCHPG